MGLLFARQHPYVLHVWGVPWMVNACPAPWAGQRRQWRRDSEGDGGGGVSGWGAWACDEAATAPTAAPCHVRSLAHPLAKLRNTWARREQIQQRERAGEGEGTGLESSRAQLVVAGCAPAQARRLGTAHGSTSAPSGQAPPRRPSPSPVAVKGALAHVARQALTLQRPLHGAGGSFAEGVVTGTGACDPPCMRSPCSALPASGPCGWVLSVRGHAGERLRRAWDLGGRGWGASPIAASASCSTLTAEALCLGVWLLSSGPAAFVATLAMTLGGSHHRGNRCPGRSAPPSSQTTPMRPFCSSAPRMSRRSEPRVGDL